MSLKLPEPIAAYFIADRGAGETVADCFTPAAVVQDEGHVYRGADEIRRWRADVAAKFTYVCDPLAIDAQDGKSVVRCRLTGDFPGNVADLRFFFQLEGDKIAALEIIP